MYIRIHPNFVVVFSILQNNIVVPQDIHSYGSGILTLRYHSLQVLNGYLLRQHSFSTVPKFTDIKNSVGNTSKSGETKTVVRSSDHITIHSFILDMVVRWCGLWASRLGTTTLCQYCHPYTHHSKTKPPKTRMSFLPNVISAYS